MLSLIVMTLLVWPLTPLVWSAAGLPKRRRIVDVVRDVALLPGPLHLWDSGWVSAPPVIITAEDVCLWPYSVGILVKLVTFLGSLHWPSAGADLGPGCIFPMLSFLFFMSFGLVRDFSSRRLYLFIGGLISKFQCRVFLLVQALIFGDLVSFLVPCCVRYVPFLAALAGFSLVLLVPTTAWEKSGHGLTSPSRETSNVKFLDELLLLSGLPSWVWGCIAAWFSAFEVLYVSVCTQGSYLESTCFWWCCFAC